MDLTKEQAKLLLDLSGQIQDQYGIIIGYSNPNVPLPAMANADFTVFDNPGEDAVQCFHKDDIQVKAMGPILMHVITDEPEHDEEVQNLLQRLNNDLLNGVIWFDPGVSRTVGDISVEVTRKIFPGDVEVFDTNLFTDRYGTVYSYELISSAAKQDKRFKIAKDIIDDTWPREVDEDEEEVEEPTPTIRDLISRLAKLFGF